MTFRVFVSSTFSDLVNERNALQRHVFPMLTRLCLRHGFRFQAIDLRWGVPEEAALDQQTMKICLQEIRRCQDISPRPNFMFLLGDRYGWQPLPCEIEQEEFHEVMEHIKTQKDIDLVRHWYRRNKNLLPARYVLLPRTGRYREHDQWEEVETRLRTVLFDAAIDAGLSAARLVKYYASATEQEIRAGLEPEDASGHVFGFLRNSAPVSCNHGCHNADSPDPDILRLKAWLKERLPSDNIFEYRVGAGSDKQKYIGSLPTDLDECLELVDRDITGFVSGMLCVDVWRALASVILKQIRKCCRIGHFEREIRQHRKFALDRARFFTGRRDILQKVQLYLSSCSTGPASPFVISGPQGSGKTALIAMLSMHLPEKNSAAMFVGATSASLGPVMLMSSIIKQLAKILDFPTPELDMDLNELESVYRKMLGKASSKQKSVYILLDGLDQLTLYNPTDILRFVPRQLPEGVRMVVSIAEDTKEASILAEGLYESSHFARIGPLDLADAETIMTSWLKEKERCITHEQKKALLSAFDNCPFPLYLKLLVTEAATWHSWDRPCQDMPKNMYGMVQRFFDILSAPERHGPVLIRRFLGYLAAARNGLSEDEIIQLLSEDQDIMAEFRARACHDLSDECLPVVVWARLYSDIRFMLCEYEGDETRLFAFYHRVMKQAAADRFLDKNIYIHLSDFFIRQPLYHAARKKSPNLRRLSELPHALTGAEKFALLEKVLGNPFVVEAASIAGQHWLFQMAEDMAHALAHKDARKVLDSTALLQSVLAASFLSIISRPETALQTVYNGLKWCMNPSSFLQHKLEAVKKDLEMRGTWIEAVLPVHTGSGLSLEPVYPPHAYNRWRGAAGVFTQSGTFEIYSTDSGRLLRACQVGQPAFIAISNALEPICLYLTGNISWGSRSCHFSVYLDYLFRMQQPAYHPETGIVVPDSDRRLVAWNPDREMEGIIDQDISPDISCISFDASGRRIVLLYDKLPEISIYSRQHETWTRHDFRFPFRIDAACFLHRESPMLALGCRDRCIRIFDYEREVILQETFYERDIPGVHGRIARVACSDKSVFFCTHEGKIAILDNASDIVQPLAPWKEETASDNLKLFDITPHGDLIVSTTHYLRLSVPKQSLARFRTPMKMRGRIVSCCITHERVAAFASENENDLWIFKLDKEPKRADSYTPPIRTGNDHTVALSGLKILASDKTNAIVGITDGKVLFSTSSCQSYPIGALVPGDASSFKGLYALREDMILAVTERCGIIRFDMLKPDGETISFPRMSCRLLSAVPCDSHGSLLLLEERQGAFTLSKYRIDSVEETIHTFSGPMVDLAISEDRAFLSVAGHHRCELWKRGKEGWRFFASMPVGARGVEFVHGSSFLILVPESNGWIELYLVDEFMPYILSVPFKGRFSCMASRGNWFVVGCTDGSIHAFRLNII